MTTTITSVYCHQILPKARQAVVASEGRNVRGGGRQMMGVGLRKSETHVDAFVLL